MICFYPLGREDLSFTNMASGRGSPYEISNLFRSLLVLRVIPRSLLLLAIEAI